MSEKAKPDFLDRESDEYRRLAIRAAFGFCRQQKEAGTKSVLKLHCEEVQA